MNKISIIVPVYNVEKYIKRCINSLVNQTYKNIEIILVNDCSPDNSVNVILECMQNDNRIIKIDQPKNMGVSAARNRGLEEASGDWIAFCDGDDWFVPEFCEKMLDSAIKQSSDFVICNYQLVSEGGPSIPVDTLAPIVSDLGNKNVIACGPVYSWNHLIKKDLFIKSKAKYPIGIGHSEELPVIPVLAKYAHKISVVDKPLYCYFQRNGEVSASNSTADYEGDLLSALEIMNTALGEGYEAEALFHITYNLFYGEILRMCKRKQAKKDILKRIEKYENSYPNYYKSKYYKSFGLFKRAFMWCERHRLYLGIKAVAKIHSLLIN